jgi:hypothetical protein
MITTQKKIILLLINTKDHAAPKRDILMRASYRKDFQQVYQSMLDLGIIAEHGEGSKGVKGSTKIVRLLKSDG